MIGGTMIVMPDNPPRFEGIHCQCLGKSGKCSMLLWSRFPAVRTMRGAIISAGCAVKSGIATWDELETAWQEIVSSGVIPAAPKLKSARKRRARPKEDIAVIEPEPKTRRQKKSSTSKAGGKKTTAQVAQEALEGDRGVVHDASSALEAAIWENAPESVRKKQRGRKSRKSG